MNRDVHLTCCLTASLDEAAVRAAVEQLSAEERSRHDRFVFARDRRDFAVAHSLLRRALSACTDLPPDEWTFTAGPHGKPMLSGSAAARTRLSFNLSHTDGLVACAVARDVDLGIDVEAIDRCASALDVAERFFSPKEIAELMQCPELHRAVRFAEIWTLKEAYVKAVGTGLSLSLHDFAFIFDGPSSLRFEATGARPASWRFELYAPSTRYRLAVAVADPLHEQSRIILETDTMTDNGPRPMLPLRISVP